MPVANEHLGTHRTESDPELIGLHFGRDADDCHANSFSG
jgi:hypothetical protein